MTFERIRRKRERGFVEGGTQTRWPAALRVLALGACPLFACSGSGSSTVADNASTASEEAGAGQIGSSAPAATETFSQAPGPEPVAAVGAAGTGSASGCIPGHYVGEFDGTYNSGAWGNGAIPLTIAAVESMGRPGLEFWLVESEAECGPAEEFCADFAVQGGKIRGFADPFSGEGDEEGSDNAADESQDFEGDGSASDGDGERDDRRNRPRRDNDRDGPDIDVAIRFEIDFGGELDCSTGQFRGLLENGCYDVATLLFRFSGTAPATYDPATTSFRDGQWMVMEEAVPDALIPPAPNLGGMGAWNASLVMDGSTPVATEEGFCHM